VRGREGARGRGGGGTACHPGGRLEKEVAKLKKGAGTMSGHVADGGVGEAEALDIDG
jgi:hypothetical protein